MKYQRRIPWIPIFASIGAVFLAAVIVLLILLNRLQPQDVYSCLPVGEDSLLSGLDLDSDIRQEGDRTLSVHIPVTHTDPADSLLKEAASSWTDSFLAGDGPGELLVAAQVTRLNPDIASILLSCTRSTGSAKEVELFTVTADLPHGQVLSLPDFFAPGSNYLKVLSDKCFRRLKAWQEDFSLSDEQVREMTLPREENFRLFALDGESLLLYFVPEGSGSAIPVQIPLRDLEDLSLIRMDSDPEEASSSRSAAPQSSAPAADSSEDSPDAGTKQIALTFDDGPHPEYTSAVLDALSEYDARATFFVTGCRVPYYPQLVQRMAEEGHAVGNHSYSHRLLSGLTPQEMAEQLDLTNEAVLAAGAPQPKLFRPPFLSLGNKVKTVSGMSVILYSVKAEDDGTQSEEEIAAQILDQVSPGCVIRLDDLSSKTPGVTRILLKELSSQGYEFVTADVLYGV